MLEKNELSALATISSSEYLTSREAAAYLHVNHRTLMDWARKGIVPGIPLGAGMQRKTWLFCKSMLDEYLRDIMTKNRSRSIKENHVN